MVREVGADCRAFGIVIVEANGVVAVMHRADREFKSQIREVLRREAIVSDEREQFEDVRSERFGVDDVFIECVVIVVEVDVFGVRDKIVAQHFGGDVVLAFVGASEVAVGVGQQRGEFVASGSRSARGGQHGGEVVCVVRHASIIPPSLTHRKATHQSAPPRYDEPVGPLAEGRKSRHPRDLSEVGGNQYCPPCEHGDEGTDSERGEDVVPVPPKSRLGSGLVSRAALDAAVVCKSHDASSFFILGRRESRQTFSQPQMAAMARTVMVRSVVEMESGMSPP